MEQSSSPNQSPASSPTDGTHTSSSSASSRPSSHLTVRPAASPVNQIRLINDHSPNGSNTPNALSPNHQLEAGEIEQAEAIQPPDTSSHHNEVLRAAANQILHSTRGSGNTLSSLVSALAKPWIDVDNFSESESSSDESPDQAGNDGARGSTGADTPVADEDFSDESHDESDEEDFEALQRKRRGMNAKKLGAALNNSQEEESTLLAARNRFPSYAHLFPQTAEDEMPIESYGIIGNCLTTALISTDATIAWYCYPHHDSPSIFHSLLDHTKGGSFKITPAREATHATVTTKQLYHTETNVLLTRFFTDSGVGHVTDYMPMGDRSKEHNAGQWLVRELEVVRGRMYFNVECTPTFDYGRASHTVTVLPAGALFESSSLSMLLTSSKNRVWKQTANGGVKTKVTLQEGQRVIFVLREWKADVEKETWLKKKKEEELLERQKHFIEEQLQQHFDLTTTSAGSVILSPSLSSRALTSQSSKHNSPRMPRLNLASSPTTPTVGTGTPSSSSHRTHDGSTFGLHTIQPIKHRIMDKLRKETMQYWRDWISNSSYEGRWREVMRRSVLMIKLLTFAPTGAIIQSPTCGLPTTIGVAGRDLRYVNLRDATLAATALLRLGFRTESAQFMSWLVDRCKETQRKDGRVEMIYTIWGSTDIPRFTLSDVEGFKHSRPVEVGKVNSGHFCFDVYGSVLNAIYLSNIYTEPISWEFWQVTRKLIDYVCAHWDEPDDGIWDFDDRKSDETNRRHFTISKMMCWVCLDRGIKLAHERSFPAPFHAWKRTRDEIYASVQEKGFNKKTNTYVQSYDSAQVDAALLLMPVMGFSSPSDPKFLSTLHFILRPILAGGLTSNGLIHQTIPESESDQNERMFGVTQSTCSFWAIEACTRAGLADRHYLDRARLLMEQMLGYGNHLGLYSEYLGLRGDHLGSYPHLLTHVCLIRSAAYLDLALAQQKPHHVVTAMTDDFPTAKMQAQPQKHPLEEGQASGNY